MSVLDDFAYWYQGLPQAAQIGIPVAGVAGVAFIVLHKGSGGPVGDQVFGPAQGLGNSGGGAIGLGGGTTPIVPGNGGVPVSQPGPTPPGTPPPNPGTPVTPPIVTPTGIVPGQGGGHIGYVPAPGWKPTSTGPTSITATSITHRLPVTSNTPERKPLPALRPSPTYSTKPVPFVPVPSGYTVQAAPYRAQVAPSAHPTLSTLIDIGAVKPPPSKPTTARNARTAYLARISAQAAVETHAQQAANAAAQINAAKTAHDKAAALAATRAQIAKTYAARQTYLAKVRAEAAARLRATQAANARAAAARRARAAAQARARAAEAARVRAQAEAGHAVISRSGSVAF